MAVCIWEAGLCTEKVIERLYGSKPTVQDEIYLRLRKGLKHPMQAQSRIMLLLGLDSFSKFDHYEDIGPLSLPPSIVFWGGKNRVLPVERGECLIRHLQVEAYHIYPDQGHLLMAEAPAQFNRDLEGFLEHVNNKSGAIS